MAGLMLIGLSGCASFRGSATPVVALNDRLAAVRSLSEKEALLQYYRLPATERANYRDYVADIYMAAADARYDEFKANLSREVRGSNFGSTATVLALNGVAIVSGIEGARALAAASAVITGTNASLGKQVFFDKTLQALLAAMEGSRTSVKIRVHTGLRLPADQYSLRDALDDIRDLEAQASLDSAIQQVTALATADTAVKKATLKSLYTAPVLDPADVVRLSTLTAYIDKLAASAEPKDQAKLTDLAKGLKVDVGADATATSDNLVTWLNRLSKTADLDAVAAKMKSITNEEPKP